MGRAHNEIHGTLAAPGRRSGTLLFRNEFVLAHRQDPSLAPHYQAMVDVDATWYPLHDVMASLPGGERIVQSDITHWGSIPALVVGGRARTLEMFDEAMSFAVARKHAPYPDAVAAARTLRAHGIKLHVKTDRKPEFAQDTRRWLDHFGFEYDSLLCDSGIDKLALCQQESISIICDDHPDLLQRAHDAGIAAVSLRWPYNAAVIGANKLAHAHSWRELGEHITAAVERHIRPVLAARAEQG